MTSLPVARALFTISPQSFPSVPRFVKVYLPQCPPVIAGGGGFSTSCVWGVPNTPVDERRLFIQGDRVCSYSGWQAPYVLLVAILAAIPFLLPVAAAWSRRPPRSDSMHSTRSSSKQVGPHPLPVTDDIRLGVRRALVDPYEHSAFYW